MSDQKRETKKDEKRSDVKLLSQGGYGCVYHPALDCQARNTGDTSRITKLQISKGDVENELAIGNVLKQHHKFENHFGPLDKSCNDLTVKQMNKTGLLTECQLRESEQYILTEMRFIQGNTLKHYLYRIKSPQLIIYKLIEIYRQLLFSIEKLLAKNVIHNDIKSSNIMYDVQKQLPIIIDFGISFFNNQWRGKLKHIFFSYEPRYMLMAPEIHFISFLLNGDSKYVASIPNQKHDAAKKIASEIVQNITVLHTSFSKKFVKTYTLNLMKYFEEILVDFKPDDDEKLDAFYAKHIEPICHTWDTYSTSIMYFQMLETVFKDRFPKVEFLERFTRHLFLNIHPDPRKRRNIREVMHEYNDLLTRHKLRDIFIDESRFFQHQYYDKQLLEMIKQERFSENLSEEMKESKHRG